MGVVLRIKSYLLVAAGLVLVIWAVSRVATDIIPALQPTPTSAEVVLESFAPNAGPLGNPELNDRTVPSGETESLPVYDIALAPPPGAVQPTLPASASATQIADQPAEPTEPAAGTPVTDVPAGDAGEDSNLYLAAVAPTPVATLEALEPEIPTRIVIPNIGLDAPVELAASQKVQIAGKVYYQWLSPDKFAAGWHTSSAYLGMKGNTVINGHHNISGKVFQHLVDLNIGEPIEVYGQHKLFHYIVVNKMILEERDAPVEQRLENARWLARSEDERLTLITCWPPESNTHRLIIVAIPDPAQQ